jgi:hypothetical protein
MLLINMNPATRPQNNVKTKVRFCRLFDFKKADFTSEGGILEKISNDKVMATKKAKTIPLNIERRATPARSYVPLAISTYQGGDVEQYLSNPRKERFEDDVPNTGTDCAKYDCSQ